MVKEPKTTVNVIVSASQLAAARAAHKSHQETINMMNEHLSYSMPDMSAVVNALTFPKINIFGDMTAALQAVQPRLDFMNVFLQSPGIQGMLDSVNAISKATENMLTFHHSIFAPVETQDDVAEEVDMENEIKVPTVFEQVHVNMPSCLPEEARLLDECIAIDDKNRVFFRVGEQWMSHAVGKQTVRIVQYLQSVAPYPNKRLVSLTELGRFSDAPSPRQKRSAVSNRLRELEKLCQKYGCKPITIKSARKRCLNPELTFCDKHRWDNR